MLETSYTRRPIARRDYNGAWPIQNPAESRLPRYYSQRDGGEDVILAVNEFESPGERDVPVGRSLFFAWCANECDKYAAVLRSWREKMWGLRPAGAPGAGFGEKSPLWETRGGGRNPAPCKIQQFR